MNKLKSALMPLLIVCAIGLYACTQSQIQQAENLTGLILQDLPAVLQILAGAGVLAQPDLTKAQAAVGQAESDFALVKTLIASYKSQPTITTAQKIQAALTDAQTNLTALLAAAHVSNPQTQATITGVVDLVISTAQQIAQVFPTQATAQAVKASNQIKLPSNQEFQDQFHHFIPAQ